VTVELEVQVYGVRDTLALLRQMDSRTKWSAINRIKASGGELVAAARETYPIAAPLEGWGSGVRGGRFGWNSSKVQSGVQIQVGGRTPRYANAYPMVTLVQKNAAGSLYDIAGLRGNARSQAKTDGQRMFTRVLTADHGRAWRGMWRNIRKINEIGADAVLKAVSEVAAEMNRKLVA
jgi:hypothetical protein